MAGIAGSCIALAQAQASIAGAKSVIDGTTSARGCTTNFIGFGLGASNTLQDADIQDFNATDDSVVLSRTTPADYAPDYLTTPGDLEWVVVP